MSKQGTKRGTARGRTPRQRTPQGRSARQRAARKKEAAVRTAAKAAEAERRERRQHQDSHGGHDPRGTLLHRLTRRRGGSGRPPGGRGGSGRQTGILAQRRRQRTRLLLAGLLAANVVLWVVRPDWEARLAGVMLSVLLAPLLAAVLFRRRH